MLRLAGCPGYFSEAGFDVMLRGIRTTCPSSSFFFFMTFGQFFFGRVLARCHPGSFSKEREIGHHDSRSAFLNSISARWHSVNCSEGGYGMMVFGQLSQRGVRHDGLQASFPKGNKRHPVNFFFFFIQIQRTPP